jgi:hypothetical protein
MSKKKEFEIDDRIDLILRSTLRAAVFASRGSEDQKNAILDVIIAAMNTEKEWKAFKESFRSAVQNEAEETLAEIKTKTARLHDEIQRDKKDLQDRIDELKREKEKWIASSEAFKETDSLLELVEKVFEDEMNSDPQRLECKKAIFNRAIAKLDEKRKEA